MGVKQVKAVINGVTTVLTLNSSAGKYEATITAPAKSSYKQTGHYYPAWIKSAPDRKRKGCADHCDYITYIR